ncbi:XRE family transcriptional regulator [Aquibium carbonis]|uniref:XRE family transcriptional regulator n=1 Tax=Aquibium carbonis TaxID=2495581 RepID=A0A3S0A3Q2_9HYPH|nr:helix-turn-helix transcriptional regulator [Aquibium carbonis]RST88191.1 XRE family transcriptional regulator [Aquibium carbonis]
MNVRFVTTPEGEEMAVLPRAEFEALTAAVDHAKAVADYRAGRLPGLTPDEARQLVVAVSPLWFWRKHRRLTQSALAAQASIAQNYLSDIENGKRVGSVELWLRLSRILDVPVDALVDEA